VDGLADADTLLGIDTVEVGWSGSVMLLVGVVLEDDCDARMSVDWVRNESCEFAEGVMREYEVVDVNVESDVNENDVELFCDGKLMIAELVMFALAELVIVLFDAVDVAFAALEVIVEV